MELTLHTKVLETAQVQNFMTTAQDGTTKMTKEAMHGQNIGEDDCSLGSMEFDDERPDDEKIQVGELYREKTTNSNQSHMKSTNQTMDRRQRYDHETKSEMALPTGESAKSLYGLTPRDQ